MRNEYLKQLKVDGAFETVLPPLTPEEFDYLEQNIIQNGCIDPIVTWNGYVVDGHNRLNICLKHDIACQINILSTEIYKSLDDVFAWMLENQLGRRNLSTIEKYEIIQKYKWSLEMKAKQNLSSGGKGLTTLSKVNTRKEMAKLVGASEGTYEKIDKIMKSDNAEIINKVKSEEVSVDKAYKEIYKPVKPIKPVESNDKNKNTDDCDAEIAELERKEKELLEQKSKIYVMRQEIYDKTPDNDLHCEVEEEGEDPLIVFCLNHKFIFYLVKGENRKLAIELSEYNMENSESIYEWMDLKNRAKEIKKDEETILLSKIFEMQKIFLEKQKIKEETWDRYFNKSFENTSKKSNSNTNPFVKEIVNIGFKQLAKVYHPDITHDDGQLMQNLNLAKEQLDKLIGA